MLINTTATEQTQLQVVMNYAAELELEVDRLRRRDQFLQQEARDHIRQTASLCRQAGQSQNEEKALRAVVEACAYLTSFCEICTSLPDTILPSTK